MADSLTEEWMRKIEDKHFPMWSEKFETGFKAIDDDHKALFEEILILKDLLERNDSPEHIEQVISSLEKYAVEHFGREETFMISAGYPKTAEHISLHRSFTRKIDCLRLICHENPKQIDRKKLLNFISSWLVNHIQKADMEYIPYLNGKRSDALPDLVEDFHEVSVSIPKDKKDLIRKFIHIATSDHPAAKELSKAIELFEVKLDARELELARKDFCS